MKSREKERKKAIPLCPRPARNAAERRRKGQHIPVSIGYLIAGSLARVIKAPHALAGMATLALLGCLGVYWKREGLRELD